MAGRVALQDGRVRPVLAGGARDVSRTQAIGALAGLIVGFLAGGVGSGVAMCISAIATSDPLYEECA